LHFEYYYKHIQRFLYERGKRDIKTSQAIYRQLQRHLNTLPIGFPSTITGVELRILKHLFTPEEAKLAQYLTINFESVQVILNRFPEIGESLSEFEEKLNNLAKKGLIMNVEMFHNICPEIPLISTEMGGPNRLWGRADPQYQAQMTAKYFDTLDHLDISEVYYFIMVESTSSSNMNRKSSLVNNLLAIKPAYFIFQEASGTPFKIPWMHFLIVSGCFTVIEGICLLLFLKIYHKIKDTKKQM
jgi:hypothetical protein